MTDRKTGNRWLILVASCIVNLCIGVMYSWSVFAGPMAEHLNTLNGTSLTAADLAIAFSIGGADGFLAMIFGGWLTEKLGPRGVVLLGVVTFGFGFIVCGLSTSIAMLILGFGILAGLSVGFAYGCTISNSVKWFPDKKGLVGGITTAAFGISSVIAPPIVNQLNLHFGVTRSFMILGLFTIIVAGLSALFIKPAPPNYIPEGWTPPAVSSGSASDDRTPKEMLSMPIFYCMLLMLFFGANFGMMAISQASNMAQTMIGMSVTQAALVVSILALFNTGGRVICGFLSDKLGRINTLTGVYVVSSAALLLLYLSGTMKNAALFYIGICLIGICFGAFMGIYPGFTNDQFGARHSSINYGIMFIGFSAAGLTGPLIMKAIFNATGTYLTAFLIAIAMAALGFLLSFLYRKMR